MNEPQNFDFKGDEFKYGDISGTIIRQKQMTTNRQTLLDVEELLVDLMKTERVSSNDDILKGVRLAWSEVHKLLPNE